MTMYWHTSVSFCLLKSTYEVPMKVIQSQVKVQISECMHISYTGFLQWNGANCKFQSFSESVKCPKKNVCFLLFPMFFPLSFALKHCAFAIKWDKQLLCPSICPFARLTCTDPLYWSVPSLEIQLPHTHGSGSSISFTYHRRSYQVNVVKYVTIKASAGPQQ